MTESSMICDGDSCISLSNKIETSRMYKLSTDMVKAVRHEAPAHYTMKVDSFSVLSELLAKSGINKHESRVFEASGYKWRLILYPNGDPKRNDNGHLSLYLAISDTNDHLPLGWEINALFKFFVFDQLQDKYLTIEDGIVRRYHAFKTEWGCNQLLPHSIFNDASNGFLLEDSCVFGVEVFVIRSEHKGEHLSMIKDPIGGSFSWKVERLSDLADDQCHCCSDVFSVGRQEWKLSLNQPAGYSTQKGKSLSLFLHLIDSSKLPAGWKMFVEYTMHVKDQFGSYHHDMKYNKMFSDSSTDSVHDNFMSFTPATNLASDDTNVLPPGWKTNAIFEVFLYAHLQDKAWGHSSIMSLAVVKAEPNFYIVDDRLTIEAATTGLSVVRSFA
ncbi:unnamed protein product [Dovyalis caffra]|uniref:MATH domain-containing protein n=1 Tax=Dovyalis caffra TaxID=77055 RepID=A0AAV1SRS0_9ROSI|nr:unnamed protein product [Dovyalis caffra]